VIRLDVWQTGIMPQRSAIVLSVLLLGFTGVSAAASGARPGEPAPFPDPVTDVASADGGVQTAVLAGGCFWGVEAVFERLSGVTNVVSGYAGGSRATANYRVISLGVTNHAESVQITFEPSRITYGQILKVFFAVAHDPTELNRQGPDEGRQYRSSIFYASDAQKRVAEAYIAQLDAAHVFRRRIVTTVVPLDGFYPAEAYHQHFLDKHPDYPYIVYNDLPKLNWLEQQYPSMLKRH
jgi:peptide-methionine (S)-S-oxide reductase